MRLLVCIAAFLALVVGSAAAQKYVYLDKTSVSPWVLPTDWPGWGYVGCIGNGGSGSARNASTRGGNGGGGGEFAAEPRLVVTSNPAIAVRAGGATTNTTFAGASVTVTCHPGGNATTAAAGVAGTGSTNTIHFDGGAGRLTPASTTSGGGGGGAGDILGAGVTAASNIGGQVAPAASTQPSCANGAAGPSGYEWGSSKGSGLGGCGALSGTSNGTAGGAFGGGGSGATSGSAGSTGGIGGDGQIFVVYYPVNTGGIALAGPPGAVTTAGTGVSSVDIPFTFQFPDRFVTVPITYCVNGSCAGGSGISVTGVTDTAGNACAAISGAADTGAVGVGSAVWGCPHTVGTGADTFTVSFSGSVFYIIGGVAEWLNMTPAPSEVGGAANGSGATMSVSTSGSMTQTTDLVVSVGQSASAILSNGQTPLLVPPAPIIPWNSTSPALFSAAQFQVASGVASVTHTWSAISNAWSAAIAAFKPLICQRAQLGVGC